MSDIFEFYDKYLEGEKKILNYLTDSACMALTLSLDIDDMLIPTVNISPTIGNGTIMPRYCAFLDVNNWRDIDKWLEKIGLAKPYERFGEAVVAQTDFVSYPLYEFNSEKLKEMGFTGFEEYEERYIEGFEKELEKIDEMYRAMGIYDEDEDIAETIGEILTEEEER